MVCSNAQLVTYLLLLEAEQAGSLLDVDLFPEAIIEIDPNSDQIVWEWHACDYLVQDHDSSKENFGVIADALIVSI